MTNASRTLLLNLKTLAFDERLVSFFGFRPSMLPRVVSSSEVYGEVKHGALAGVPIAGLVGDQQGALVGNKCLRTGEAKCTYGTGAFLLFCTGSDVVLSKHGLLSTVAYKDGATGKPVYALEGSSTSEFSVDVNAHMLTHPCLQSPWPAAQSSGSGTRCRSSRPRPR